MNKTQYLLTVITEESSEVIQDVCKAIRFGLDDVKPGQPDDNRRKIEREIAQLIGVARMLGLKIRESDITQKIAKVKKYMAYSVKRGTLEGRSRKP